jgi:hypothetical protein
MSKMIFDKEETINLINMLQSSDEENHILAFEALKNVNINEYMGELLVMYKYAKSASWEENGQKLFDKLQSFISKHNFSIKTLSSPQTLSLIGLANGSKASVELFVEFFVKDMTLILENLGYPMDKLELNIKLK